MRGSIFAFIGGAFITLQGVANSQISQDIGTWQAAMVTQLTGFMMALLILMFVRDGQWQRFKQVKPLYLTGGALAAIFNLSFNLMYPVEVRLASYLLSVSFDESDYQFKGQISTVSLMDAANLIGTSYRHMNRVIQRFCSEDLIERKKGFILVRDREGLSALANHNIYE